ncbi:MULTISPECIES: hypothetical protein [unclassified Bradyrhizobium]|uniref:hypothetical protein n=1 Tax=unclassified Bradyrhizobium TaxID=2631580 RepID=UPI002FF301DA
MSKADLNAPEFALFHPAAHYDSPAEVLDDLQLSDSEKRVILSSWASDMFAIESCPGLRDIPGMGHTIRLADILSALRQLDGNDDRPPPAEMMAELMPINSPLRLTSAPPELPGLIAASVWMKSS